MPPLSTGDADDDQSLAARMLHLSRRGNTLQQYVVDNELHRRTASWKPIDESEIHFPRLDEEELRMITCGTYQLKLCASYAQEHIDGNSDIHVHKDEADLLRVRIQSRHVSSKTYLLWIRFSEIEVTAWYCRCRAGARVVGVCAHIAAVIWYLGYARHLARPIGIRNWGDYLTDASDIPPAIDDTDNESSDEEPEE